MSTHLEQRRRACTGWCRAALLAVLVAAGCGRPAADDGAAPDTPRVETVTHGDVRLTLSIEPARVQYDRDALLTLDVEAPRGVLIGLPALDNRAQGFILSGSFEDPVQADGDRLSRRLHARLTPLPGVEHRIAPIPVTVTDQRSTPPVLSWFPTRPMVLDVAAPFDGDPGADIAVDLEPVWVYPPFRVVASYVVLVLVLLAALWVAVKLLGRVRRQVQLMRMSPRERALKELAVLLAKDLVGRQQVKEFYLQLTMIVRRYIERAHRVRAPEQTTEEFLEAVSHDPRFTRETVARLTAFLEAADLVKFAAHQPPETDIRRAIETARNYIESDTGHTADGGQDDRANRQPAGPGSESPAEGVAT